MPVVAFLRRRRPEAGKGGFLRWASHIHQGKDYRRKVFYQAEYVTGGTVALVPKIADPQKIELVTGDGKTVLVELPSTRISSACKVARPAHWALGKTITDAEGKSSFLVYGTAPAPHVGCGFPSSGLSD